MGRGGSGGGGGGGGGGVLIVSLDSDVGTSGPYLRRAFTVPTPLNHVVPRCDVGRHLDPVLNGVGPGEVRDAVSVRDLLRQLGEMAAGDAPAVGGATCARARAVCGVPRC